MSELRFSCSCGKVNRFTVGPERAGQKVTVKCGACRQLCRLDVPAAVDKKKDISDRLHQMFDGLTPW